MIINSQQTKFWTTEELKELTNALNESGSTNKPVMYKGHLVRFNGSPTFMVYSRDEITVEGSYTILD